MHLSCRSKRKNNQTARWPWNNNLRYRYIHSPYTILGLLLANSWSRVQTRCWAFCNFCILKTWHSFSVGVGLVLVLNSNVDDPIVWLFKILLPSVVFPEVCMTRGRRGWRIWRTITFNWCHRLLYMAVKCIDARFCILASKQFFHVSRRDKHSERIFLATVLNNATL